MGKFFFQSWTQNLGRNGWDQPLAIPEDMSAESFNVELREGGLGKKRSGSETVVVGTSSGGTYRGTFSLGKFIPGNTLANQELWYATFTSPPFPQTGIVRVPGAAASAVMVYSSSGQNSVTYAQLDGKFFLGYDSSANRTLVYAPNESTTALRYAGLKPGGAPTVANTGAGTYAAVIRYYRVRFRAIVNSIVVRTSEASPSTAFTPSGGGTAARVTQGTLPGEGETHWVIEAAQDDTVFWELAQVAIATTTYDDSVLPANYPSVGTVPPLVGECYPFPSCKYVFSDGVRLYGIGVYETSAGDSVSPVAGRLYFTPAIGSSDLGDSERIVNTSESSGWIDVAVGAGGDDTGIAGKINGAIITFQIDRVTAFLPTGNAQTPLRRSEISDKVGALHGSAVLAEDESGNPALYFMDQQAGPYRIGAGYQLQWLGKDIKDLFDAGRVTNATAAYDSSRKLVIWVVYQTVGVSNVTSLWVFDVTNGRLVDSDEVRKGWVRWTKPAAGVGGGVMFASDLASHTSQQSLYLSNDNGADPPEVIRMSSSLTTDSGSAFQAYIRSKAYRWAPIGRLKRILESVVVAKARSATTVLYRLIGNWGTRSYDQTISIAPVGSETYVRPRPNPEDMTDLVTAQVEIGDSAAVDNSWEIEAHEMQVEELEQAR